MNVFSTPDGQVFVWDSDKASSNALQHGVRFEQDREAFLDPLARYEDASPQEEARQACIGLTTEYRLQNASQCDSGRRCAPPHLRTSCGAGGKETL